MGIFEMIRRYFSHTRILAYIYSDCECEKKTMGEGISENVYQRSTQLNRKSFEKHNYDSTKMKL